MGMSAAQNERLRYTRSMIRQIVPVFFTTDIPGTIAYYKRQAWLRMPGDVAGSAGLRHRGARSTRHSLPLRNAAHP